MDVFIGGKILLMLTAIFVFIFRDWVISPREVFWTQQVDDVQNKRGDPPKCANWCVERHQKQTCVQIAARLIGFFFFSFFRKYGSCLRLT